MKNVNLNINRTSYQVLIAPGLLKAVGEKLEELGFKNKIVIITNPVVKALYGNELQLTLQERGLSPYLIEVPDGEAQKSLEWAGILYGRLSEFQANRVTPILALGGGVIGDLAGFVAATYMRGLPLVHLPTSLLAQVDSSIGGKVAVNHGHLKNMIGAFYQPRLVMADISVIESLPLTEVRSGLAEVIKYGIIQDKDLFNLIEKRQPDIDSADRQLLEEVVFKCVKIKAEVVEKDERDLGLRNILNFGHTTGHAIEAVSDFKVKHGEAVALGMIAASMLSNRMGILPESDLHRIKTVVARNILSAGVLRMDVPTLIRTMVHDKKRTGERIRFILPECIGKVFISDEVNIDTLKKVLEELFAKTQDMRLISR